MLYFIYYEHCLYHQHCQGKPFLKLIRTNVKGFWWCSRHLQHWTVLYVFYLHYLNLLAIFVFCWKHFNGTFTFSLLLSSRLLWSVWEDCCCVWWDRWVFLFNLWALCVKCSSLGQREVHRSGCAVVLILVLICLKVNKVEKFKRSQAKEDALHAKYNLSEQSQVAIWLHTIPHYCFNLLLLQLGTIWGYTHQFRLFDINFTVIQTSLNCFNH